MASEHGKMSGLESLIVDFCRRNFYFSELKVKGLVMVEVDKSTTTYLDVDKTISRDEHGQLDVGPRNALEQWKKSQNSEQASWQNQWQQQPHMRGSLRASVQSPSQRFRMPQMPARVRMIAPPMQSPKMSSARMQQPYVPQSVVRLKKIPSPQDASENMVSAVVKSVMTKWQGHNEREAEGATTDCLPSGSEIEDSSNQMNNLAHSLGAAQLGAIQLYNQTPLPTVANKNKRKNGNQQNLLVSSGRENGDSKEPWKKNPKLLSGQKAKKAIKEHSEEEQEEEEMKEVEENMNCKPQRPKLGIADSKEQWKKIPKLPSGQRAKKALKENSEEGLEEEEMKEMEENMNCKPQRPKVGIADAKEPWNKNSKMPHGQKTKKALVEHPEEEEEDDKKDEKEEEEEGKNGKPNQTKMLKEMTASLQTIPQDLEALAQEHLTSKAAPRKRAKVN